MAMGPSDSIPGEPTVTRFSEPVLRFPDYVDSPVEAPELPSDPQSRVLPCRTN